MLLLLLRLFQPHRRLGDEDLEGRVGNVVLSLGLGDSWRWELGGLSVGVLAWS